MASYIRRRKFLATLGGAAVAWPLAARAQQAKLATIGLLGSQSASTMSARVAAFVQRLRELGWIEGRTIAIELRWAEARTERFAEIAAEFVRLKVDVIVASSTPATLAAKQATTVIPIIFPIAMDPVGSGLVASLARPGGNVTGLSVQQTDTTGKRLSLLREVIPNLRRVGLMINVGNPAAPQEKREVQAIASALGLESVIAEIRRPQDIVFAFEALKDHVEALYLASDALLDDNRLRINILALGARLPTMWAQQELVEAGGLMSYGPSFPDQWRRAADLVDKVLRGTNPADIPVEQPVKFVFALNLIVAKALGLTIPPTLLARADEVIE